MARKFVKTAGTANTGTEAQSAPGNRGRTLSLSPALLVLIIVLTFVCGLLAGSMFSHRTVAQQTVSAGAAQPQSQPQASAPQQQPISPEMQRHIMDLESVVIKEPKNRDALVQLGNAYFDNGQFSSSISAYEAALKLDAKDANVLTDCGVMYRAVGKFDKALEKFVQAQQVEPGHVNAMFNQGVVLNFDLHQHEEGLKVWRDLATLHPDARTPDGRTIQELITHVESESH